MRNPFDLRLVERELELDVGLATQDEPIAPPPPPRVLARVIRTPPGLPWEQTRGAMLEARHGAPLPIEQTHLRLKRLAPWRPRADGSFAAFYVRISELNARLETVVEIEGRPTPVVFEPPQAVAERARRSLIAGLAAAGVVCLISVAVAGALLARAQGEERLSTMERNLDNRLRRAVAVQAARRESAALSQIEPGARVDRPLADLAWAMAARDPDARLEAWRWDHGVMEVEARGDSPPFTAQDRALTRSGPVRPGVWTWRVESGETRP